MKTLLYAAILAASIAVPVRSEQPKVKCVKKEELHFVTEKLGAEQVFLGSHPIGIDYVIFINPSNGYWLAISQGDKLSCILVESKGFVITASKPK